MLISCTYNCSLWLRKGGCSCAEKAKKCEKIVCNVLEQSFCLAQQTNYFFKVSLSWSVLTVLRSLSSKITTHLHWSRIWVVFFLWSQVLQFHLLSHTSTVLWNPSTAHGYNYHRHYTEERKLQCDGDGLLHRPVVCILNL